MHYASSVPTRKFSRGHTDVQSLDLEQADIEMYVQDIAWNPTFREKSWQQE